MLWFDYLNAVKHFHLPKKKLPPDERAKKLEALKDDVLKIHEYGNLKKI